MNPNDAFDSATTYLGDLDAEKAAYGVAVMIVASTLVLVLLKKSGFRAMVAVGS
jgi:hypothetical protein